jgi:hypothetical protein
LEELKGAAAMEVGEEREEELKRIRVPLIPIFIPKFSRPVESRRRRAVDRPAG